MRSAFSESGPRNARPRKSILTPARADVLVDDRREGVVGVLLADRALEILELQHPHRRVGIAEDRPLLRDARDERDGRRRSSCPSWTCRSLRGGRRVAATAARQEDAAGDQRHRHDGRDGERDDQVAVAAALCAVGRLRNRGHRDEVCLQPGARAFAEQCSIASWTSTRDGARLVEAGIAITSELSLDAVLQTLVRIAAELTGRAVLGARCDRSRRHGAGAVRDPRARRRDSRRDRRSPARPRDPRRPDRRCAAAAPRRSHARPALGRLPAQPPADAQLPRRPGDDARRRLRQPLPRREAAAGRLHARRTRRSSRCSPRRRRSRSRTPAACSGTRCAGPSRRRRWSAGGSPGSSTTRRARR